MHNSALAKRVHELKETRGVKLMCHEMEKIYSEGMESSEKRGELKIKKETALSMAEEEMDVKQIARLVKVTIILTKGEEYGLKTRITKNRSFFERCCN